MSTFGGAQFGLVIAEPWFTLRGHPAQSVLNTARTLGRRDDVVYVISRDPGRADLVPTSRELEKYGSVRQFTAPRSPALATARALLEARRIARRQARPLSLFFLDAHLLVLALLTPLFRATVGNVTTLSALGLVGPESFAGAGAWRKVAMARWLAREDVRLFLRTQELAAAWRAAFSSGAGRIDTLPSLEIPPGESVPQPAEPSRGPTRFGVLGQIRRGKGLEWLVPLFETHPQLGELRITGNFFDEAQRQQLPGVARFKGFSDRYLRDEELLPCAAALDYLLVLYDSWDSRLEAATFYLAARARRPVICYDSGWCGRMIREYGCGLALSADSIADESFFRSVPTRDSQQYELMLRGADRFRLAHGAEACRAEFLQKVSSHERSEQWKRNQ